MQAIRCKDRTFFCNGGIKSKVFRTFVAKSEYYSIFRTLKKPYYSSGYVGWVSE